MPRNLSVAVENNFVGGLNTQASGLNFPTNAAIDTDNCVFNELGFVTRRLGLDFEKGFTTKTINRTSSAVVAYNWKNVTGDGAVNLLVKQVGGTLYFYIPTTNAGFSSGALATTIDLTDFLPSGGSAANVALSECQFTAGLGYLVVTHPLLEPFYITYTISTQVVTGTLINIKVRDTEGVSDSLAVDNRPNTLSATHTYNLHNQGWFVDGGSYITDFNTTVTDYPSNSDVWWVYKNTSGVFDATTVSTVFERGTSQAPKGHFIYDAFDMDREATTGFVVSSTTSGLQRRSTSAFYAGRVWYAGTSANGYESKIFFSQLIEDKYQLGLCYQKGDPTSESANELVADDGGHLFIPGAGRIHRLIPVNSSLIVFSSNGIWQITGSTGIGFTALDYTVNLLASIKAISSTSFVDIDGYPAWWNTEGIHFLIPGKNQGTLEVNTVSDNTIKDFYLNIPLVSKASARGSYDPRSHVIQWLYKSEEAGTLEQSYEFDRVLNFNTLSQAFYPWSLDTDSDIKLNGIFLAEGLSADPSQVSVIVGADSVVVGLDSVVATTYGTFILDPVNKFVVSYADAGSYKFTFAEALDADHYDWFQYDSTGISFDSYFITGYKMPTKGLQEFQNNYVFLFSDISEIGGTEFYFQGIWNFANSGNSGKYSSRQLVNHTLGNFDIVRNKLKLRGTGYAVQFKFTSVEGEPFHIIGWTVLESSNARE